jgi:type II secretory pathway predicted ATPase ExeA
VALFIDEAQGLEQGMLEKLPSLSNPRPASESLLQVILAGQQPELEDKLNQPRLSRLRQSITLWCQLEHLKAEEVSTFIYHRLRLVGYERQDLFSPEAIRLVALYSQGIPRLINLICDNALRVTCESSQKTANPDKYVEEFRTTPTYEAFRTKVASLCVDCRLSGWAT